MAILTRPRLLAQQRYDLEDYNLLVSSICGDWKNYIGEFWSSGAFVLKGFTLSGLNAPSPATLNMDDATLILADSGDYSFWSAEDSPSPIDVTLQPGVRNYIEAELVDEAGTPLTRAFWDPSANGGEGSEFNQTINTVTTVRINIQVLTGGFSGSSDRIPLYIVDTDGSNNVTGILDRRDMFFRLGSSTDADAGYTWGSKTEPGIELTLSGVAGTFIADETVTFTSGATATVKTGGTGTIVVINPSSDSISVGDTVDGGTSTASGTLDTFSEFLTGADKSISNLREMLEAMMTEIRLMKGTDFWFEAWSYSATPNNLLPAQYNSDASFSEAIGSNAENINSLATTLNNNVYDEDLTVVSGAPADDNEITGPVLSGGFLTLPLDGRDSNAAETYQVGNGTLEVYLNGQLLTEGQDWQAVGAPSTASSQIEILRDLNVGEVIKFRIDTAGGFFVSSVATPDTLQSAYAAGSSISISSGNPMTINGPAAEKLFVVNGDIEVTGVIDPLGLTFTSTGSNPLNASDYGLWVNTTGDLIFSRDSASDVNLLDAALGQGNSEGVSSELTNNTGSPIGAVIPVSINASGDVETVDVSSEASVLSYVGVTSDSIVDGGSGEIVGSGKIEDITTTFDLGDPVWISKSGGLTNTKPDIGVDGFLAGDFVVFVGIIAKNADNASLKDLIVKPSIPLQL